MSNNKYVQPQASDDNLMPGSIPALASVGGKKESSGYSAGTIDESMLTDEEKEIVSKFASEIDISDVNQIVKYGVNAQRNISDFSVSVLKKVKTYDMGEVGESFRAPQLRQGQL